MKEKCFNFLRTLRFLSAAAACLPSCLIAVDEETWNVFAFAFFSPNIHFSGTLLFSVWINYNIRLMSTNIFLRV